MNKKNLSYVPAESQKNDNVELLSRADACKFLHVSQSMLDSHLNIPKVRIGRKVLYMKDALISFIHEAQSNE